MPTEQLRDIRGLDGFPWWPPAPGWILVALLVVILVVIAWRLRGGIRLRIPPLPGSGDWRWDAARALRELRRRAAEQDARTTAGELSALLRRIAMAREGRAACAGLSGEDWLGWLEAHDPNRFEWTRHGRLLLVAPYAPPGRTAAGDRLESLIDAAYDWVSHKN